MSDTATTDTNTLPEIPHARDAEEPTQKGNWLVLFAPDGEITVARQPPIDSPAEEQAAFYREAFRNIPPGVAPKGVLGFSFGNNTGGVNYHLYEGAAPSRAQLVKLRPFTLARYSARIFTWGEVRYEENFPGLFGLTGEPAILRTGPEIGPVLAASCIGKHITHGIRPDGLRVGGSDIRDFAGFIDHAECDADGIIATLLIVSPLLHRDLEDLAADGELESARLCLSHSARAIPRRTGWNLTVFDVTHASANYLNLTSLSHSPGTFVLRRLAIDEPLGPADYRPVERLHVPRRVSDWRPSTVVSWPPALARDEPAHVATIAGGAVTEKFAASGTTTVNTTSGTTADIADMSESIATIAGDLVIVTLRMREIKIENLSTSPQNVTVFVEITDGSNNVINGDADDHWTFPLSAAGGGAAFVVVPVNIVTFDSPGTTTSTYKGRWRVAGSVDSNVKVTNANSRRLQVIRTKR